MNLRHLIFFSFLGFGCGRARLRTSLPPQPLPDPRCAVDKISKTDANRFLAAFAGIGPSYAKSEFYVGNSSDSAYGFVDTEFPWASPDSAVCMRLTVARSPHCPTPEGSLDCRIDWYWWQMDGLGPFSTAMRRIQLDQKSCRLASLYSEFLSYPHSEEEKAGVCLGMLMYDPEMYPCLPQNKAALQKLVKTKQRQDQQTYATLLLNSFFDDTNGPLWDREYDDAFTWIEKNLFPLMDPRQDAYASWHYYRVAAIRAFRIHDKEALMQLIAKGSREKSVSVIEMYLLVRLGIKGDESQKMVAYGAAPGVPEMWASVVRVTEKFKREGHADYDPLRGYKCSIPNP